MNKQFKYPLLLISLMVAGESFAAGSSIGISSENFSWKERDSAGNKIVHEAGPRFALHLTLAPQNSQNQAAFFSYQAKGYLGRVDYGGSTFAGASLASKTKYKGMSHEGRLNIRGDYSNYIAGLGWENWRRSIWNPVAGRDQLEDFNVIYMRLGLDNNKPDNVGLHWAAGIKYPLYIHEDAHLNEIGFSTNPSLTPGKSPTFYGELGYRIPEFKLNIVGYYDAYRMLPSGAVAVRDKNSGVVTSIFQPKSTQHLLGVKWLYEM